MASTARGSVSAIFRKASSAPAMPRFTHPLPQRLDLLAQPLLAERDADHVLFPSRVVVGCPVAHQVEAGGDDLALEPRQVFVHRPFARAACAHCRAAALGLPEVAPEGPYLEEVDVRERFVDHRRVVARDPVIGDQVADLQFEILHEDRVRGRRLRQGASGRGVDAHGVGPGRR